MKFKTPHTSPIDKILKDNNFQSIEAYREMLEAKDFLSTGWEEIDALIANGRTKNGKPFGGFPRGAITEISGQFGCYKTTLMKMVANRPDVKALYIDTEGSFSHDDIDNHFDMVIESNIEKIWGLVNDALDAKYYDLIVVDSIAGATTEAEMAKGNELAGFNTSKSIALNQWFRGMLPHIQPSDCAVVFVNQLRDKIGLTYSDTYTPGGKALEFFPSLRLQLFAPKSAKVEKTIDGKRRTVGQKIRVKVSKSRYGPKNAETTIDFLFDNFNKEENETNNTTNV